MKRVATVLAALAALGIATPAFACGDKMENTKSAEAKPAPQKVAKAAKKSAQKPAADSKTTAAN